MLSAILSVAPSLISLFTSDNKSKAVQNLTNVVVGEAAAALGIKSNTTSKKNIIQHLEQNPNDVYKLKKLESDFELRIKELDLEDKKLQLEDKNLSVEVFKEDNTIQKNLVWHINIQFYFVVIMGIATLFTTAYLIEDKGLAMAISGFVSGLMTMVTNRVVAVDGFFFGSSLGSKEKTQNILKKQGEK